MPITLTWLDDEQTILLQKFPSEWTVQSLLKMVDETRALVNEMDQDVCIIMDFSESQTRPMFNLMNSMAHMERNANAHIKLTVIIATTFLRTLFNTLKSFAPKASQNVLFAESQDEALQIIQQYQQKTV